MPEEMLRRFFEPEVLAVLDALYGGDSDGQNFQRIAAAVLDINVLASEPHGRKLLLEAIPKQKREELEARVERSIDPSQAQDWSKPQVDRLCEFFGLLDEGSVVAHVAQETIVPDFGLFDHQRGAVRELLPLLTEGERRAVLHLPTGVGKTRTAMHAVSPAFSTTTIQASSSGWLQARNFSTRLLTRSLKHGAISGTDP